MRKTLLAVSTLLLFALTANVAAQQSGWMSRYWDGCKPSCSWKDKTFHGGVGVCKECDKKDAPLSPPGSSVHDNNTSSCEGGNAYTCWDMIPFPSATDKNLAYGFAATPSDQCGMCFELTFDGGFKHGNPNGTHTAVKGKKLIVMGSNMGHDVGGGQFDFLIPGGGLGNFDSFSGQLGIPEAALGKRSGGLFSTCEDEIAATVGWMGDYWKEYKPCLTEKCETVFKDFPKLKQGCLFHANWLEAVNNPTITYKTVECPQLLKDIYSGAAPGGIDPNGVHTLTLAADPPEGGTVTPAENYPQVITAGAYPDIASGEPFAIKAFAAAGYVFEAWSVTTGGELAIDKTDSTKATVTLSSDATVTARFAAATYTLTLEASPPEGGTVIPAENYPQVAAGGVYPGIASGEPFAIKAVASDGYVFERWIVAERGVVIDSVDSVTATVTLSSDATVTASFALDQVGVRYNAVRANGRAKVSLKPAPRGFAALLPTGHGYTAYSLIDLRGREVRSGKIGAGVKNLQFNNLSRGVMFLRLEGKGGAPVVLRAVTY